MKVSKKKLKVSQKNFVEVSDWDELVRNTYGRPYSFQQQDGCKERGIFELTVPSETFENVVTEIPEIVNHDVMGVNFKVWLARDPNKLIPNEEKWGTDLWWERNFYPDIQEVANDLYEKGFLEAGDYVINIDW